ncbi:MAG: GldG family protein [Deltaproteobacteria bacterium]
MNFKDSQRRLLLGGGTGLGIVIFLAIIVAIQYIAMQHPERWDLTQAGKYTLAPQSKKVLETFGAKKIPIQVVAFYESQAFASKNRVRDLLVRDLLDQYRDAYSHFTYSFVDPDLQLSLAKKYGIDTYPTLIIEAAGKDERITTADEESITNALLKLLRTKTKKVYFVKGHGELSPKATEGNGMSVANGKIKQQNYQTEEIVLMQTASIPDDASMLIIAGPKSDFMDSELEVIRPYLKHGGKLMVLLNPFKSPKLTRFLKDYGFVTADDIVVDRMSRVFGGDYLMPVITTYIKSPITKNFKLASFFPEARSVRVAKKTPPDITAKELALTSPMSWTIDEAQLKSGHANFNAKTGIKGPVPVMAMSTYSGVIAEKPSGQERKGSAQGKDPTDKTSEQTKKKVETGSAASDKPVKARLVVFGSSEFASNKFFKLQGNGDLFMNTVSWLAEEENLIAIRPKSTKSQPVILTAQESWAIFLLPVVFIPSAWFIVGVVVYVYRRRTAAS